MKANVVAFCSVCVFFISSGVLASSSSDLTKELSSCSKISQDGQRLTCFDNLAQSQISLPSSLKKSKVTTTQVKQVVQTEALAKEAKKTDDFSKQHLKKAHQEKGLESITATISKLKKLIRGQWVISLENGQKWQQKDSGKIKLKVGDSVRLKKGTMGAVYLFKKGSSRNIRVKRLK